MRGYEVKKIDGPLSFYTRQVRIDDSSNIDRVEYDPINLLMKISFVTNRVYLYRNVPASVFGTIVAAKSPGEAFNKLKKDRLSQYEEVK